MKKEDFKLDVISGKRLYMHIKNGNKRIELLQQATSGKITAEEMRKEAKKLKYLYSEKDYLKAIQPSL